MPCSLCWRSLGSAPSCISNLFLLDCGLGYLGMLLVAVVGYFLIARLGFGGKRKGPASSLSLSQVVRLGLTERLSLGVWVPSPDGSTGVPQSPLLAREFLVKALLWEIFHKRGDWQGRF